MKIANCWARWCRGLGEEAVQRLIETLQTAPANEATEVIGLLSQLVPEAVEKILPVRLAQWPRTSHDRAVRQLSSAPAEQRARLLVSLYDSLDPLIRPLALDEMGMSGGPECIPKLVELAQDDNTPGFTRIKAIEAAGRLRASAASPHSAEDPGSASRCGVGFITRNCELRRRRRCRRSSRRWRWKR